VRAGKETSVVSLKVTEASFPTITLTLPAGKVVLNDQDLKRAKEEERRLEAIWEKVSPRRWSGSFLLPLEHEISTPFGTMRIMNEEMRSVHRGIDIRGSEGDTIRASNDGVVVLAEELFFGGNTVILDHGTGIYTIYMHLSKFAVAVGDIVPKDGVIGYVGSTGRASGPHLHFSVKVDTISTDPLSLISLQP
jgi:murein DD-endopeptidase MepM/ murein hydrolase activator NlpD